MQLVLSERKFSELIRQLEGINDSDEEISVRLQHYITKCFAHLGNYGVHVSISPLRVAGTIGTFQARLDSVHSNEDRQTRLNGLAILNPISLNVEYDDLPAFFQGIVLAAVQMASDDELPRLQGLTVPELSAVLDGIGERAMFGKPGPNHIANIVGADEGYEYFLEKAGKKDPLAEREKRDAAEQAELARIEAAREERYQQFRNGE